MSTDSKTNVVEKVENPKRKLVLRSQAREVAANVYKHIKYEAENGVERLTDARWRTAKAVGVSERTISRILKEKETCDKTGTRMRSPHKHKNPRKRIKRDVDAIDKAVIRHTITSFHRQRKQFPTLQALKKVLTDSINFNGCQETLRRILLDLGYEWKTTEDDRRALVEKHDIQMLRYKYLKQLMKYREEERNIVFTDETYIDTTHVQNTSCGTGAQKKTSKGSGIIIVHAGGRDGFVPNASLIYKASSSTGDYRDNMNHENYMRWFKTQLLPNIPEKSVIVMDNASYHNMLTEKVPTADSDKTDMQEWLRSKNIDFDESTNMKKIELYDTILKHKDNFRNYVIDEEAKKYHCDILRLPPYHPDLNPIENIWGMLKNYVANKSVDQTYTSIVKLVNERLNMIDLAGIWYNTCCHVEEIEAMYWKDYEDENEFIIHVGESDAESDISSFVDSDD